MTSGHFELGGAFDIDEAARAYNGRLEECRRTFGDSHAHTTSLMSNLASVLKRQGRLSEAEELQQQALEARDRVLGPEHPDTLASSDDLMSTYMDQH